MQKFVVDNNIDYFEWVSAKEGFNIKKVFQNVAEEAYSSYLAGMESMLGVRM